MEMVALYRKIMYNKEIGKGNSMKRNKGKLFFVMLLIFIQITEMVPVRAEPVSAQQEIRVGLTELYSGKEALTICNNKLGYGYCVDTVYLQEVVLESSTGFVFKPVNGYLIAENKEYVSYQAALQATEKYRKLGVDAYPGSTYQCCWHVYFGTASKQNEAGNIVKMLEDVTGSGDYKILDGNNYRMQLTGSFGTLFIDVDEQFAYPQFRPLTAYENGVNCVNMGTRVYRGRVEIGRYDSNTLTAVNIVPLEEYLYGVVPAEMPSDWHEEALKAQAVCARSYALIKAGFGGASNAKKGYKIVDTVSSQVYKGYLVESVRGNNAVNATKGEMVCYNDKVVSTYYFSTSGGRTEASADVWAVDLPYLQSVPDLYEHDASREVWRELLTLTEIKNRMVQQGIVLGEIDDLSVLKYSDTNRAYALRLKSGKQSITLQGTTIRTVLNLYSTKFKIVKSGDIPDEVSVLSSGGISTGRISNMYLASSDGVNKASQKLSQYIVKSADNLANYPRTAPENDGELLFAGMGYGHGVGMSQYGAKGMAEAGYNYKEIIEYYFTGASVR